MQHDRQDWIDSAKGIGILLVVIGHATTGRVYDLIYLFHMPLFFIIAGLVFRPAPMPTYLLRRARTLLVPYTSFLVALTVAEALLDIRSGRSLPQVEAALQSALLPEIYGGRQLVGDFGAFWFVPSLFTALCAYNLLRRWLGAPATPRMLVAMAVLFLAAYPLGPLETPWNLTVNPMAMVFIWIGDLWSTLLGLQPVQEPAAGGRRLWPDSPPVLALAVATAAIGIAFAAPFDMKFGVYGTPLLSALNAVALSHLHLTACRHLCHHRPFAPIFRRLTVPLGLSSIVILFLHRFFVLHLLARLPVPAVIAIATAIPFLAWLALRRGGSLVRFLFLGDPPPPLRRPASP